MTPNTHFQTGGMHPVPPVLYLVLLGTCAFWAVFSWATNHTFDNAVDMLENYMWGIRWQWGNSKHPPLFGWIVASWFEVFPKTKLNYWILSSVNLTISLWIMILIARRFLNERQQLVALLVALALPLLGAQAMRYNANAAMLPFWAGLILFYMRLYEKPTLRDAALLGLFGALGMLSKYFTMTLILALFIHAMLTLNMRQVVFSKYGALATVIFFGVLAPHIKWLFDNDFSPITFAADGQGDGSVLYYQADFFFGQILYLLPGFLALGLYRSWREGLQVFNFRHAVPSLTAPKAQILLYAFLGSMLVTMVLSLVAWSPLTSNWTVPAHITAPILLVMLLPLEKVEARPSMAFGAIALVCAVLLAISPFIYRQTLAIGSGTIPIPFEEIAEQSEKAWSPRFDQPAIALGGDHFATYGNTFFLPGTTQLLDGPDLKRSPWVLALDFSQPSLMLICANANCAESWRKAGWQLNQLPKIDVPAAEGAAGPSTYSYFLWAGSRPSL